MRQSLCKPQRHDLGKVTIIELLWVTLFIGGSAVGLQVGYVHFGIGGAVVGLLLGFGAGLLVSCGIAFLLNSFFPPTRRTTNKPPNENTGNT
jgi:hypothetical protein